MTKWDTPRDNSKDFKISLDGSIKKREDDSEESISLRLKEAEAISLTVCDNFLFHLTLLLFFIIK